MSYAVLYKANETDFNTLGLGVLRDAISPLVTEERNGQFEFSMSYPVDGTLFDEIKNDRIIKADASQKLKAQRFKIIRITKPAGGVVKVYAEHVSYLSQDLALKPSVSYNGNATQALTAWKNNIVDAHPFTIFSDVQTTGSGVWTIDKVENARRALGGVAGSILDTYGGEYRFDNYHIGLYANRGSDSGALIAYGKNLTDIEQEEEIANTYTSIYPYTNIRDEEGNESLLTLPEYFVDSEYTSNYARRKIKTINFQQDDITTVEQLRERAQQYIADNDIGVPSVNLTVKFVDLSKTLDYKDLALVEEINLCDQVTVYYEKLGIRQKAKVIKTVWNVALDRYEELVIGKARANLSQSIGTTVDGKLETVVTDLNSVRISADGKTKIFTGVSEPIATNINDLWYKPVEDGGVEMYRWDGVIWGLQKSSAGALSGTIDFANIQAINIDANAISTGTLTGANMWLNLVTGEMQYTNPTTGDLMSMKQGRLQYQTGQSVYYQYYDANGLTVRPSDSNTGDGRNTGMTLIGNKTYFDFLKKGSTSDFDVRFIYNEDDLPDALQIWNLKGGIYLRFASSIPVRILDNYVSFVTGDKTTTFQSDGFLRCGHIAQNTTSAASNVHIRSDGIMFMIGSASKYKSDIQLLENEVEYSKRILDLHPKSWIDKGEQERADVRGRYYGVIAEDVESLGLSEYTTKNEDGELESVQYDRLWTLLLPVVREQETEIKNLKQELADLKALLTEKGVI